MAYEGSVSFGFVRFLSKRVALLVQSRRARAEAKSRGVFYVVR